jgi:lipid-A-disaccharide synthase
LSSEALPRLLISCGEPSGDAYGGALIRDLRRLRPDLVASGLGGDQVEAAGGQLVAHLRDVAVVGLLEVVRHLGDLRAIFARILAEADRHRPDVAVLVDYPDFNLRLARELKRRGIPVVYYVSPQVWAWRRGRIRTIRDTVARMLVLFPFEEAIYRSAGVPVTFVGHPLLDQVKPVADREAFLRSVGLDPGRPVLAVLPGSRPQEVAHNRPPLVQALRRIAGHRPDVQFVLAAAPTLAEAAFGELLGQPGLRVVRGQTHAVLSSATAGIVASGTATVEAAILGLPMVVVYRVSPLTHFIGRPLMRVTHFAMVNLIAGREVVPELMQRDFTAERTAHEALDLLENAARAARMRADLAAVRERLGAHGASARAAEAVAGFLRRP